MSVLIIEIKAKIWPFEPNVSKIEIKANMILIPNTDFDDHNTLRCHKVCRVIKSIIFLLLNLLKWKGNIKLSLEKVYVTCVYMLIHWRKFKFSMRAWENIVCMCYCVSSSNPVMTLATRGVFVIIPANNCFILRFTYDGHMYLYTHIYVSDQATMPLVWNLMKWLFLLWVLIYVCTIFCSCFMQFSSFSHTIISHLYIFTPIFHCVA